MTDGEVQDTKKEPRVISNWIASWREGSKVRNVHLGSCKKVDHETALQKGPEAEEGGPRALRELIHIFYNFCNALKSAFSFRDGGLSELERDLLKAD